MMRWFSVSSLLQLFVCLAFVARANAITSPSVIRQQPAGCPSAFGLKDIIAGLRGGEVIEGTSAAEVDAMILKAGSDQSLVVIDFTATWCGPCQQIAPIYKELSENFPGVVFLKVDVDANPDTAAKYSVSAMPTFLFIKGGEVVDRLMGANPARLQELINEHK